MTVLDKPKGLGVVARAQGTLTLGWCFEFKGLRWASSVAVSCWGPGAHSIKACWCLFFSKPCRAPQGSSSPGPGQPGGRSPASPVAFGSRAQSGICPARTCRPAGSGTDKSAPAIYLYVARPLPADQEEMEGGSLPSQVPSLSSGWRSCGSCRYLEPAAGGGEQPGRCALGLRVSGSLWQGGRGGPGRNLPQGVRCVGRSRGSAPARLGPGRG